MTFRSPAVPAALALALALPAASAWSQGESSSKTLTFSGSVALGAEHNSNLSVSQLESASGKSDIATTLDGNIDMNWRPTARVNGTAGYSYSGSRYRDIESFDLDMHLLFADLSYDFKLLTIGANYYFADANLGGDDFLHLNQYSVYAGKLFGAQKWYIRGALTSNRKTFTTFITRDADNAGASLDLYRFFNMGRSSLSLGYAYEDEDTRGAAFDYAADTLRLRLSHRFRMFARSATLRLGYRWQDRAYASDTPSIGRPRDDSQQVADARLELTLREHLNLIARWENGDYSSYLPSADFNDSRFGLALELFF